MIEGIFGYRMRNFWLNNKGTSMVEMTIVTPFLLFLGLGAAEFSHSLYHHHLIVNGLRDAARYLARVDNPTTDSVKAKNIAATGEVVGGVNRVSWWGPGDVSVSVSNVANPIDPITGIRDYRGGDTISIVRVSTNVNHPGLGFLSVVGISSPLNTNVYHEERNIGE